MRKVENSDAVAASNDWTFDSAAAFWSEWEAQCDDAVWPRFSSAEQHLLSSRPETPNQASIILGVLIANAETSQEAAPLIRLHDYLRALCGDPLPPELDMRDQGGSFRVGTSAAQAMNGGLPR